MKKIIIAAALAFTAFSAFAQNDEVSFLPQKGNFSMDLQFNPISTNFNAFQLNGATVVGHYYLNDKNALRFSLGFNVNSNKHGYEGTVPSKDDYVSDLDFNRDMAIYNLKLPDYTNTAKGDIIIGVGYERHFGSAKRLDPYVGAGLGFDIHWANYNSETHYFDDWQSSTSSSFKNTWKNTYSIDYTDKNNDYSSFSFLLGAVAGFNFYVCKGLYLGAELGLKMDASTKLGGTETFATTNPSVSDDHKKATTKYVNRSSSFAMGFYAEPAIHIGWTF